MDLKHNILYAVNVCSTNNMDGASWAYECCGNRSLPGCDMVICRLHCDLCSCVNSMNRCCQIEHRCVWKEMDETCTNSISTHHLTRWMNEVDTRCVQTISRGTCSLRILKMFFLTGVKGRIESAHFVLFNLARPWWHSALSPRINL